MSYMLGQKEFGKFSPLPSLQFAREMSPLPPKKMICCTLISFLKTVQWKVQCWKKTLPKWELIYRGQFVGRLCLIPVYLTSLLYYFSRPLSLVWWFCWQWAMVKSVLLLNVLLSDLVETYGTKDIQKIRTHYISSPASDLRYPGLSPKWLFPTISGGSPHLLPCWVVSGELFDFKNDTALLFSIVAVSLQQIVQIVFLLAGKGCRSFKACQSS